MTPALDFARKLHTHAPDMPPRIFRMRDEMRTDANRAAHSEGALMVYEKQMAKLSRHCAQTRAMLDAYNK